MVTLSKEFILEVVESLGTSRRDLTVIEAAEHFGRSPSTIRSWIGQGHMRAYKLRGRQLRITAAAVAEFEENERAGKRAAKVSPHSKVAHLGAWRSA